MNYHKHRKDLQNLLREGYRPRTNKEGLKSTYKPGCYILSKTQYDPFQKLGMSSGWGGLIGRIDNYKICYPKDSDMWVKYLVICPRKNINLSNGKKMHFARKMELLLAKGINTKATEQYSEEWMLNVNATKLQQSIKKILNDNRVYWSYVLKLFPEGWVVVRNDEHINFKQEPTLNTNLEKASQDDEEVGKLLKELGEAKKNLKPKGRMIPAAGYRKKPKRPTALEIAQVMAGLHQV